MHLKVGKKLCLFHPKALLNESFFLESEASPPTRLQSSSPHSGFLLLTHIFDSFHEKKKKKGLESTLTCSKGSWSSCRSSPAPESEINPWKGWHRTKERSFPHFPKCTQTLLPQSPPWKHRTAAPSGNSRTGIKGEQDL